MLPSISFVSAEKRICVRKVYPTICHAVKHLICLLLKSIKVLYHHHSFRLKEIDPQQDDKRWVEYKKMIYFVFCFSAENKLLE
jgi:hypothetical protein